MDTSTAFEDLRAFRRSLHRCFDRRADALFELGNAMLTAALDRGRIDIEALREPLARPPLADERPPIYAVDVNVWARCDAETSPERGFYYHPIALSILHRRRPRVNSLASTLEAPAYARSG